MTLSRIVPARASAEADVQHWQLPQFGRDIDMTALTAKTASAGAPTAAVNQSQHDDSAEQGYNDGLQLAARQSEEKLQLLDAMIEGLGNPSLAVSEQVIDELLNLAQEIARQILQRELSVSPDELPKLLEAAIALLPKGSESTVISANTQTVERLQQALPTLNDSTLSLIVNDSLNDNSFTLKKGRSFMHGGLDAMLERVAGQFTGAA